MSRVMFSLIAFIAPLFIGWLGGMEFERGFDLAFATAMGMGLSACVYTHPGWKY